ncbi:MAG: hypothetical protein SPI71_06375 [Acidaminococcaceae bacterium]|nr:hypothetical protein [Acidaminococcaceae bacterium]
MKKPKENNVLQVEFICPKCHRHLAWATSKAEMQCPSCGKWVNNGNRKKDCEVFLPLNDEQLVLFD